jgi:Uma2 family endonuclease
MIAEPQTQRRRWTYDELRALNDGRSDERRVELYDGEIEEMTSPTVLHQKLIRLLLRILEPWIDAHGGEVYLSPVDLYLSATRFVVPDLMFVSPARLQTERIEREDGACLVGPPDLVVEVLSPSTARNDRVRKFNEYAAFGVLCYWIIDPEEQTLLAYSLQENHYLVEAALTTGDTFEPSLFPGLRISLDALFAANPKSAI